MTKRQLNESERKFTEKGIKRCEEELEHLEWLQEYNDLMLNKGLKMNYLEKVRVYKAQKAELENEIKLQKRKIENLKKQLIEGVDIKNKPTPPGVT